MKFSLVATLVVVLALAIGSQSQKPETPELEKLTLLFQDISATLTRSAQELVEKLKAHEETGEAQTDIESKRAQLEPLIVRIQEELKTATTNIETQLRPLDESMRAQMRSLTESLQTQVENLRKMVMEQLKALPAPQ